MSSLLSYHIFSFFISKFFENFKFRRNFLKFTAGMNYRLVAVSGKFGGNRRLPTGKVNGPTPPHPPLPAQLPPSAAAALREREGSERREQQEPHGSISASWCLYSDGTSPVRPLPPRPSAQAVCVRPQAPQLPVAVRALSETVPVPFALRLPWSPPA